MGGVLQPWTYENFWLDCRYSLGLWGRSPGKSILFKNEYGSNSVFYLQTICKIIHQIFSRLDHPYIFHCWLPKSLTRPSQSDHKSLRLWTQHLQLLQSTNDLYLGSSVGTEGGKPPLLKQNHLSIFWRFRIFRLVKLQARKFKLNNFTTSRSLGEGVETSSAQFSRCSSATSDGSLTEVVEAVEGPWFLWTRGESMFFETYQI